MRTATAWESIGWDEGKVKEVSRDVDPDTVLEFDENPSLKPAAVSVL